MAKARDGQPSSFFLNQSLMLIAAGIFFLVLASLVPFGRSALVSFLSWTMIVSGALASICAIAADVIGKRRDEA